MSGEPSPRAVVVDDSGFMRTVITDLLEGGGIEVVDRARNGEEAVEAVATHRPDVVTMDVEMPVMDGVEAVEHIMAAHPTPVLMLSAHTDDEAAVTFEALEKGAVDFFTKPGGEVTIEMTQFESQLVQKVRSVARSEVATGRGVGSAPSRAVTVPDSPRTERPTVVIGASTGGPSVIEDILSSLPLDANLRLLVVQHMPAAFTPRYATRLDDAAAYRIREATDGASLGAGEGLLAPGDHHLTVEAERGDGLRVGLNQDPPVHGVRPAVDPTMESAAAAVTGPLAGVLLTGMGRDGSAGVEAIAGAGGRVIVQDEATSAVFGMPKRAIQTGHVDSVLPAGDIPQAIVEATVSA